MKNQTTGLLYLNGSVDGSPKTVYPTKFLMYGLQALGLEAELAKYRSPSMADGDAGYATLFWMAYQNQTASARHQAASAGASPLADAPAHAPSTAAQAARASLSQQQSDNYPYLAWARNHYTNGTGALLNSGIYPLSSEGAASDSIVLLKFGLISPCFGSGALSESRHRPFGRAPTSLRCSLGIAPSAVASEQRREHRSFTFWLIV
jgi:hypothetical protein